MRRFPFAEMSFPIFILSMLIASACGDYQFIVPAYSKRCFQEEIPLSTHVSVSYTVIQGAGPASLSFTIKDMEQRVLLDRSEIDHGKYAFTSADSLPKLSAKEGWTMKEDDENDEKYLNANPAGAGDNRLVYTFCFEHKNHAGLLPHMHSGEPPARRVILGVHFGADSRTKEYYDELAKEKHLSSTEEMFRAVEDRVADVVRDVEEMRQRERRMDLMNRKTQRTVLWYNVIACLVVLGSAIFSSYATRAFLSREKVI